MDDKLNDTYITLGGYVEVEKYRYIYFANIFIIYVLILCCNSIIVSLIVVHKNLHDPMYIFIAALLTNSVLFSTAIYPKLLIDFLSEKQIISHTMCHFQYFIFYTVGGAEFLLLSAMAHDRYVSIIQPLQYHNIMRKTTVCLLLVMAWLVPFCLVAGSTVLSSKEKVCNFTLNGIFCNNSVYKLHCVASRTLSVYGVIVLLSIVFLPMIYVVFTYARILIISYFSCKTIKSKAAQTCLPHLLVLLSFSLFCAYDIIVLRLEINISKMTRFLMTLQMALYNCLFNPIIYGLKLNKISKHLKKLFVK
uniref:G-protein coupled receptors family 1 profile domain-containing protein n=1 Tax=Kryptolebias marmoratus TaxID=37003 RepID=A0A3Q2ZPJ6_KRYMA